MINSSGSLILLTIFFFSFPRHRDVHRLFHYSTNDYKIYSTLDKFNFDLNSTNRSSIWPITNNGIQMESCISYNGQIFSRTIIINLYILFYIVW